MTAEIRCPTDPLELSPEEAWQEEMLAWLDEGYAYEDGAEL